MKEHVESVRKKKFRQLRQWRRGTLGRFSQYMIRHRHIRGTWIHKIFGERIFSHELWHTTKRGVALGLAFGVFWGLLHVPGQMICASACAYFFRANIASACMGTFVSNPFTSPFEVWLQYDLGRWILGRDGGWDAGIIQMFKETAGMDYMARLSLIGHELWNIAKVSPMPLLVGYFVSAVVFAVATYMCVYLGWGCLTKLVSREG